MSIVSANCTLTCRALPMAGRLVYARDRSDRRVWIEAGRSGAAWSPHLAMTDWGRMPGDDSHGGPFPPRHKVTLTAVDSVVPPIPGNPSDPAEYWAHAALLVCVDDDGHVVLDHPRVAGDDGHSLWIFEPGAAPDSDMIVRLESFGRRGMFLALPRAERTGEPGLQTLRIQPPAPDGDRLDDTWAFTYL